MNGGHEFFSSLFGEFLVGRDCSDLLQDPNADPTDREICNSLLHFQKQLRQPEGGTSEYGSGGGSDDPQKLRDEILYHQPSRHSSPRQDRDLDGKVGSDEAFGRQRRPNQDHKHYSSSKTVIITQKPDGTYEEKLICRDSEGQEETTTRSMESDKNYSFYKNIFGSKKS